LNNSNLIGPEIDDVVVRCVCSHSMARAAGIPVPLVLPGGELLAVSRLWPRALMLVAAARILLLVAAAPLWWQPLSPFRHLLPLPTPLKEGRVFISTISSCDESHFSRTYLLCGPP